MVRLKETATKIRRTKFEKKEKNNSFNQFIQVFKDN